MATYFWQQLDAVPGKRVRDLAPHFLADVTVAFLFGDVKNAPDLEPVDGRRRDAGRCSELSITVSPAKARAAVNWRPSKVRITLSPFPTGCRIALDRGVL